MTDSTEHPEPRRCPWCSAAAPAAATHCPACGAALAQRESIGDLVIPGVTSVDPALQSYAAQPLRIPGASPSQAMAGGAALAAATGGVAGVAALGSLAVVAAAEYLGAGGGGQGASPDLESIGKPSEAALTLAEQLDREGREPPGPAEGEAEEATGSSPDEPAG